MCTFFSFMVDREGNVYSFLDRPGNEEYDSHSYIAEYYKINEDQTWKFDLNFCAGSLVDFAQMNVVQLEEFLKEHYDGGLPLEEMPATIASSVLDWLIANRDKIVSIGIEKFGKDLFMEQLQNILSNLVLSETKKKVSLYRFPVAFTPDLPQRTVFYAAEKKITVYINYTANLIGYMGVSFYVHPYVDKDGNIQEEYRANIQLFPVPQKVGG